MAVAYYHFPNTTAADAGSTALGYQAAKVSVDGTDGTVVTLDGAYWNVTHTGLDTSGSASTGTVFYRVGTTVPTVSYAVNSAATRASLPILSLATKVLKIPVGQTASFFFKAQSGATVVLTFERGTVHEKNAIV